MNKFQEVQQKADIVKVAQYLNLNLNKSNKCLCPFHKENTPSFSISQSKQIFKCFGCGVGGNCITLVSKLLHINNYEAAKQINSIFNLGVDFTNPVSNLEIKKHKGKIEIVNQFRKWENETFQLLCDYLHLLWRLEEKYEPKNFDDDLHELYVEALQNKDYIQYLIDEYFIFGTNEDKLYFYKSKKELINKIKKKIENERRKNEFKFFK